MNRRRTFTHADLAILSGLVHLLGLLGFPGCSLPQTRTPPAVPAQAQADYADGMKLLRAGRDAEAKALLLKAIEAAPHFVDAHRLYQEAALRRFEIRPIVQKYDQLLRANPNDPALLYLNGRLRTNPREQQELFSKAVALDPAFPWACFGLAHVAMRDQDPARSLTLYRKALALWQPANPIGFLGLAVAHLRRGQNAEAAQALRRALALDPENGAAWLLLAKAQARLRQYADALKSVFEAIRFEPENGDAHDFCRLLLQRHGTPSDYQAAAGLCRQLLPGHPKTPELPLTLALAQHRGGDLAGAVESYEKARSLGASPSDYANDLRLLCVRLRHYGKALDVFNEKAPPDIVLSPRNIASQRFRVLASATQAAEESLGNVFAQLHLAHAYENVGWLDEALAQYGHVGSLKPAPQDLQAKRFRVERHIELCKRIRAFMDENYFCAASGKPAMGMSETVRRIHKLAAEVLPSPIQGDTKVIDYPFLGKVTDFHYPPAFGLQKYFWQFGQFFAVGKTWGEPVQCILMNVINWEPGREETLWDRPLLHDRMVAENAGVRGSDEVLADARIGGQTVDRFYYVDIDRVWESVAAHMQMNRKLGSRLREAQSEPPEPGEPRRIRYLSCVPEILRWQALSRMNATSDEDLRRRLFQETLAGIDAHELGHVLDAASYVPIGRHLLEDLGLLIKNRFSTRSLMAMTERNAQLTALVHAPEPRFILAGTIVMVAHDMESTSHQRGYAEIVEGMVGYAATHPKEFRLDPARRLLDQFPQLSASEIGRLARAVAQQDGLPQRAAKIPKDVHR